MDEKSQDSAEESDGEFIPIEGVPSVDFRKTEIHEQLFKGSDFYLHAELSEMEAQKLYVKALIEPVPPYSFDFGKHGSDHQFHYDSQNSSNKICVEENPSCHNIYLESSKETIGNISSVETLVSSKCSIDFGELSSDESDHRFDYDYQAPSESYIKAYDRKSSPFSDMDIEELDEALKRSTRNIQAINKRNEKYELQKQKEKKNL